MPESFDFAEYARHARKLAKSLMCARSGAAEISGSMHLLSIAAEQDLVRFDSAHAAQYVACGPGCGSCCVLNVAVLFPEAISIVHYMQKRLPQAALEALRERLQQLWVKSRWLDDEERLFLREPCAFLDAHGSCMVHAVRPLLCRSITSTDPASCRDAIVMAPLGSAPQVVMNLFQKTLVDTIYRELATALAELGLDSRPKRLTAAVLKLLDEPDLVNEFAAGTPILLH